MMMQNNLKKQIGTWLITSSLIALSVANFVYLHHEVMGVAARTSWMVGLYWSYCLPGAIMDVGIIFLMALILTWWRPRLAAFITYFATAFWTILNACYARLFHQYFPLSALGETGNITHGYYGQYLRYMFERSDCFLLLGLLLVIMLAIVSHKWLENDRLPRWWQRMTLLLLPLCTVVYQNMHMHYSYTRLTQWEERYAFMANLENANEACVLQHGCVMCQWIFPLMQTWHTDIQLSREDAVLVESYLSKQRDAFHASLQHPLDTTAIRQKNLIFLLVESYLSYTSDLLVDGCEVTPNLNRLRHLSGTYYNGKVGSNIAYGESSDGQFIYMTGLYPNPHNITVSTLGNTTLLGLPRLLKEHAAMSSTSICNPSSPSMWRQSIMNPKYGIDTMRSFVPDVWDDAIVLDSAYRLIEEHSSRQPCFFLFLTSGMHAPYHEDIYPWEVRFPEHWSNTFCHYLQKCHYTDEQIGRLLERLENDGILANSIIVIAADHQPQSNYIELPQEAAREDAYYLPFYIVGADIDTAYTFNGSINQVDIYPTLLDLYGVRDIWPGIGCSILRPDFYHDSYNDEGRQVSQLILKSDYLR